MVHEEDQFTRRHYNVSGMLDAVKLYNLRYIGTFDLMKSSLDITETPKYKISRRNRFRF